MVVRATHAANQRGGWWVNLRMQRLFLNMPEPVLPLTRHWASRALRGTRRFTCWATSSAHFTIIGYQLKSGQNPGGDVLSIAIRKKSDPLKAKISRISDRGKPGGLRSVRPTKDLGFTSGAERSPSYRIN